MKPPFGVPCVIKVPKGSLLFLGSFEQERDGLSGFEEVTTVFSEVIKLQSMGHGIQLTMRRLVIIPTIVWPSGVTHHLFCHKMVGLI